MLGMCYFTSSVKKSEGLTFAVPEENALKLVLFLRLCSMAVIPTNSVTKVTGKRGNSIATHITRNKADSV